MIKVSYIIPVYNTSGYIDKCIESIINQSINDIEIICIDDGSTDDSIQKLLSWKEKDKRVSIINNKSNRGLSYSRNLGMRYAKGEYIWFVDSDDSITDNEVGMDLYKRAKDYSLDILSFEMECVFENSELKEKYGSIERKKLNYPECCVGEEMYAVQMKNDDYLSLVQLYLFKRSWLLSVGIQFEDILHEDMLFTIEAIFKAKRVGYYNRIGYLYYRRGGSITTADLNASKKATSLAFVITELISKLSTIGIKDTTMPMLIKYYKVLIDALIRNILESFRQNKSIEYMRLSDHIVANSLMEERYPMISCKLTNELSNRIHSANEIVVYGAGNVSKQIQKFFKDIHMNKYQIAVTDARKLDGVVNLSEIENKNSLLIIAASGKNKEEMVHNARHMGFTNVFVVT